MNRHPFRWEGLAFGAFFLAVAGNWAVWKEDLLTGTEMSYLVSSVLIVLGLAGVVATFWKPRPTTPTITPTQHPTDLEEISHDEAPDTQH